MIRWPASGMDWKREVVIRRIAAILALLTVHSGWALPPDVVVTRSFLERGSFAALAERDSSDGSRRWALAGTSVEGLYRFFVVRVDSAGDTLASFRFGSTDRCNAITASADSSIALVGWTTENNTADYKLMRVTDDGSLITNRTFGSTNTSDIAYGVTEYPLSWYLVAGKASPGIQGPSDATLVHISQGGTVQWTRDYAEAERACTVTLTDSGGLLIVGTADSVDANTRHDAAIIRADSAGIETAMRRIGGPLDEMVNGSVRVSASRTILVGMVVTAAGDSNFWIAATNDNGDSLWSRSWGTPQSDVAWGVTPARDADSGFVVAGWSKGLVPNRRSGVLMKFDHDGDSLWTIGIGDTSADVELVDVVQDSSFAYRAVGKRHDNFDHPFYVQTDSDPRASTSHPPSHFSLLTPGDGDTLTQDTIHFDWETAIDPDSGDQVIYALLLDSDTLFQNPIAIGPLFNSRYNWVTDTDDVHIFWRVSAQDEQNHVRVCDDRSRQFVRILPDSTGPFSLVYPDSGMALTEPFTVFRWQRPVDPDLNDTLHFTVHFATVDSSFEVSGLQDTFITMTFVNHPFIDPAEQVEWWVTVHSVNPVMQRDSREHWTFVTWSTGADPATSLPLQFGLQAAYPNPFNASTRLEFTLDHTSHVTLQIFDLVGRRVASIVNGQFAPGGYRMNWDAPSAASGIYFARLTTDRQVGMTKLMLIR
jgi:hypothetical protein